MVGAQAGIGPLLGQQPVTPMKGISGLILSLLVAGSAEAASLVLGEGLASACSQAAFAGRADPDSVLLCKRALEEESLDHRDRAGTLVNRGVMLLRNRSYAAALLDIDKAIRLEPKLGEAYVNRGVLLMADRRYEEALAEMNRGMDLGVDEPAKAFYNRALVHESLNDAKSAFLDYRRAQELAPEWSAPTRQLVRFSVSTR
jgi:tetratricopeptide (TPR) repeat protein